LPDGYDAAPAGDWWDDLYGDEEQAEPRRRGFRLPRPGKSEPPEPADDEPDDTGEEPAAEEDTEPGHVWWTPQPGYYPHPHMPAVVTRTRDRADAALSTRTRHFLYNASASGAGWGLGLYHQFAGAIADCGARYSISGALVLGIGGCLVIAHVWDRHTRHWWPGIAWVARIPLATALTALALWAPAAT
jgi:hypothetical protein